MILTLEELKAMVANKEEVAGEQFRNSKGSIGTVREELSEHGKLQADMTCTEPGCKNYHTREASDWHQCHRCHEHRASKRKVDVEVKRTELKAANVKIAEYMAARKLNLEKKA